MPIDTYKLGPGTLTLGAGALAVQQQLLGCKIVPTESVNRSDARKVLSGEELAGDETATYTYTLQGTFLQTLLDGGVLDWSWTNEGTEQAFVFTPSTAAGATFTGTLVPVPLQVGGDEIEARPEADFTWRIVGKPVPVWDAI